MRRDLLSAGLLLALALLLAVPFALSRSHWYTDSLYYEAQKLEVMGASQARALREVFAGPLARPLQGHLPGPAHWAEYARFYRRRWVVPAIAAALTSLFGTDALRDASLLGWALLAPLLFGLLRRAFPRAPSIAASALVMLLPPLLIWAPAPLVDSWGATMLVAGLLLALLAIDDIRWLPAFAAVVVVGSFTRDVGLVLVPATIWLALVERERRTTLVAGVGLLASVPAPLIFSAPLRQNLAYVTNGFTIPRPEPGWGGIASAYPGALLKALAMDVTYPLRVALPYSALAVAFAIPLAWGLWLLLRAPRTRFITLIRAAAAASLIPLLLSPNYTGLRLELVAVPAIAVCLAFVAEGLGRRIAREAFPPRRERDDRDEADLFRRVRKQPT